MQVSGGLLGAFDIWEMAIVQALLNNSETWYDISEDTVNKLEEIQNLFLRVVLDVPASTPKPALLWETGFLPMSMRVMKRKLRFMNFIKNLGSDSLSKQIYNEQIKNNWPGPVKEAEKICEDLNLPNITENTVYNDDIDAACKDETEKNLKQKMENLSKLKDKVDESFQQKEYLNSCNIFESRTMFRARSKMLECKMNFSHDPKFSKDLWMCDSCKRAIDTQSHVMICPAYSKLREGKDVNCDEDLVKYLVEVMKIRERMGFRK